jgi:P-type Ca2+ transporter type 2C
VRSRPPRGSIALIQEIRSERVIESLRELTSPRALVIRDGVERRIAGREVVRGDIVAIAEGDRVPADATLLLGRELQVDESLLTGESVPVRKTSPRQGPSTSGRAATIFRMSFRGAWLCAARVLPG